MESVTAFLALLCLGNILGSCCAHKVPCETKSSSITIPGDATIIGIFDMYTGANCSTLVTEGIHQMLSAVWVVQELNRQNFIPGVTLGLLLYDACSEPLTAQKALKTGLQETVCLSTYPSGVVTTPSISTHLQELVATAHLPVFVTSSEYPAVVSTLTASLLSALNWSQVAITLAPSTEYISTFGQAASREDICVHHQASFADRHSSIWATAFQASEPRQKGNVALVFGSTNEILRTVQVARDDNTASTLQWVLVPLNIPQELSFLGNVPADSLIVTSPASTVKDTEEILTSLKKIAASHNNSNYNITSRITSSPLFLEVATPIFNISRTIRSAQARYCKPSLKDNDTGLCQNLPPFHELSSQPVSDSSKLPESNTETLLVSTVSNNSSYYVVQRVKTVPKHELDKIGTFQLFYNNTALFTLVSNNINMTLFLDFAKGKETHCISENNKSSCKNACPYIRQDEYNEKTVPSRNEPILSLPITWRGDAWVAAIASIATVGIACSLAISAFILIRICKGDVLEGNPSFSFLLLIAINFTYFSILPFSFVSDDPYHRGLICGSRIFGTNVSYALLFSIMLSRSFMLASCDQDGGFMSHVNGYLQTVLCFFIAGVQLALSVQFWAINSSFLGSRQCSSIYDGHLFLFLLSYDIFLLLLLVCTSPFIARSKRNYQEGIFFTVASFLCLITFIGWIAAYVFVPRHWQDAAITGGLIGTATVILVTVFIPRTYLMMTAIVRDHLASALPSLAYTSTTSIQDINYRSTQVLYDTVTPHPLIHTPEVTGQANPNFYSEQPQSPVQSDPGTSIKQASSEIGFGDRRTVSSENTYARYDTPPSPHKVTRF
ncbi:protein bride of sevenless isoform X2 [Cryptotermes secundus]|uniref:protein bride of sevenless isoform X2 n=1 Tax=Cryptotermes secundus TaxID=105785 RepID=UPI000CD7CFCF|nr:protein bride of sevenless isoform X2 [Cryptotermes secundus]